MGIPVIIAGKSGSGKSASIRNMDPETTLWIRAINKPPPFKPKGWKVIDLSKGSDGNVFITDDASTITVLMKQAPNKGFKSIIVDDAGYIMTNEFMRRVVEKGYDKFSEMAKNIWSLFVTVKELPEDVIVYFVFHTDVDNFGTTGIKTIGKLLSEKVSLEGMATIVLLSDRIDGKYIFRTQNSGMDIAKSPIGLFSDEVIPNDLAKVDEAIKEYYSEE